MLYAYGEVDQEKTNIMDTEKWKTYEALPILGEILGIQFIG
jgi:hypothetical protein